MGEEEKGETTQLCLHTIFLSKGGDQFCQKVRVSPQSKVSEVTGQVLPLGKCQVQAIPCRELAVDLDSLLKHVNGSQEVLEHGTPGQQQS